MREKNKEFNPHFGDIVMIPFPFTNLSLDKVRPALVMSGFMEDVTVIYITRKSKNTTHNVLIEPNKENRLKYQSSIITSKIATLDKRMILGKLGVLNENEISLVKNSLKNYLNL